MSPRSLSRTSARQQAPPARGAGAAHELRCECGSLLARIERGEIELKCRRCKRVIVMTKEIRGAGAQCVCSRT